MQVRTHGLRKILLAGGLALGILAAVPAGNAAVWAGQAEEEAVENAERVVAEARAALEAATYDEEVLLSEAYDEEVLVEEAYDEPVYEGVFICNMCGYEAAEAADIGGHCRTAHADVGGSSYRTGRRQIGTVHHEAVYETVHHEAVYETVPHDNSAEKAALEAALAALAEAKAAGDAAAGTSEEADEPEEVSFAVAEGEYYLFSGLSPDLVLDIRGGSMMSGANARLYVTNGTEAQRFRVRHNSDGTVTFISVKSGNCLDAAGAGRKNGTNVHQYKENGTGAQKWIVKETSRPGFYTIQISYADLVLDAEGGRAAGGTNAQLYQANGSRAQQWKFVPADKLSDAEAVLDEGDYRIVSGVKETAVLDIRGGLKGNCANAQLYQANGTKAQTFHLAWMSDGTAVLTAACSGKVLDAAGAGRRSGTNVQQYAANGTAAQRWRIRPAGGGYFTIEASYCGLVLDAAGGSARNGTNVRLYTANGTAAQRWKLVYA